ncbi:lysosome-associated membrane glycoprotein 1 [Parasteatoda tepidariorum]|uniref:lysosome-associated membrane glycoprotein 1 n=1 Tax=Parasteatoda tepidariorum TaxID=114398 RepID=UPI001C7222FA|nr:lysosome-associated membrane glycoprotein 1 [Parasteatoda tepidariorum]
MKITLLAFAVIFLSACSLAQNSSQDPEGKSTDVSVETSSPISSSSSDATTTTSTLAPTTTASSSSVQTTTASSSSVQTTTASSSSAQTTTSSEPTTTSVSPTPSPTPETTTSHETTTSRETTTSHETSVLPTSSTESPVTTTAPIPVPEPGYWNVTEGNTTCIRANLAIRFKIEINGQVDYILLRPTASSDGSKCNTSDGTELLLLKDVDYNIIFVFEKSSDNIYVKNTSFTYYLPFSTETFTNDSHFYEVKAGNSYLCKTPSDVILGNATMEVLSIHLQAFGAEHNKDFGSAEECGADSPINDVVPIAVGVALLALVIVVLIAYLVGRRRSRQRGYQSV